MIGHSYLDFDFNFELTTTRFELKENVGETWRFFLHKNQSKIILYRELVLIDENGFESSNIIQLIER